MGRSQKDRKKASPPLSREDAEQYTEVGVCVLRALSIQFGEIVEDVVRAMLDQKSCYGICHDMKEWSVENESSFTKINLVVVEGFFMGRSHI